MLAIIKTKNQNRMLLIQSDWVITEYAASVSYDYAQSIAYSINT